MFYRSLFLLATLTVAGCVVDYYPNGESKTTANDVVKNGPDSYGGTNAQYDATKPAGPGQMTQTGGAGVAPIPAVGTYGGSNTGGGGLGSRPNTATNGTADTGSSAPR